MKQQQRQALLFLPLWVASLPSCASGFAIRRPILHAPQKTPINLRLSAETSVLERTVKRVINSTNLDTTHVQTRSPAVPDLTSVVPQQQSKEKVVELAGLGTWIASLSGFLLFNNYVGPFPSAIQTVPVEYFGLMHALSAMLFGGGIILTTLLEWLAVSSKNASVLDFYFSKVPILDKMVVLPAVTLSIVSGVGLAVDHYGMLGQSPFHVVAAISTLLAFAGWWGVTDLTTQGAAKAAIGEWKESAEGTEISMIVQLRKISNVVSCIFVLAIYAIMVLKPGFSA